MANIIEILVDVMLQASLTTTLIIHIEVTKTSLIDVLDLIRLYLSVPKVVPSEYI